MGFFYELLKKELINKFKAKDKGSALIDNLEKNDIHQNNNQ